jgi:hypothetical protein
MSQMPAAAAFAMSIAAAGAAQAADGVRIFSDGPNHQGFNDPRGVRFGPDGYLYIAEAGLGGATSTAGQCAQVPGPPLSPGPYTGGLTARISKVSSQGIATTVIDGLPSGINVNKAIQGVTDLDFIDDQLYGGGCSHGISSRSREKVEGGNPITARELISVAASRRLISRSWWPVEHPQRQVSQEAPSTALGRRSRFYRDWSNGWNRRLARRIPAIVSFLNPQPALSVGGGNRSSCPVPAIQGATRTGDCV